MNRWMSHPSSPLTGGHRVELVHRYATADLVRRWRRRFAIEVGDELAPAHEILHWRCLETELEFFHPLAAAGSSSLYEQLARFRWYHDPNRWDFGAALPWLRNAKGLLEVGCGDGAFLDLLGRSFAGTVTGIEFNSVTAKRARSKGHKVIEQPVESDAVQALGPFDAICSFQVLEHIPEPLPFLQALVSQLSPGGTLVLGVPNAECFIRHWRVNLLDLPPHHMSRWTTRTLAKLGPLLGLEPLEVQTETLSAGHSVDFIEAQVQRVIPVPLLPRVFGRLAGPILSRMPSLRQEIPGHSLLGIYRKPSG
jgi:2-polyprenyl-3-methyl-5-hydroxy-6-metoxy-1,4-benzoquinol methylase